ncbi:hypothetical protein ACL02S_00170 [Nocardia sp. 004]|uniref:hypothetical protein n=1 Tax=Nocardia sp. 004 TaxID=3385978 RepID=UPI0039A0EFB1
MATASEFQQTLRGVSSRVPGPRGTALSTVCDDPPTGTGSIIRAVRSGLSELPHHTVYGSSNARTAVGSVQRIQLSGSTARDESRVGDDHYVVCRYVG